MGVYINNEGTVATCIPNHSGRPVVFGYLNDGSGMKKFFNIESAIDYIEVRVSYYGLNKTDPASSGARYYNASELSGYGSITINTNSIEVDCTRNSCRIEVFPFAYVHFKGSSVVMELGYLLGPNRKFEYSIVPFQFNVTGFVQFRPSTSYSVSGYADNRMYGDQIIASETCSTTSTVTKTLGDSSNFYVGNCFVSVAAGRVSGSPTLISKMTINSCTLNGVTIPVKFTNLLT